MRISTLADENYSYLSPKLEVRPSPYRGPFGVFAKEFVPQGELLALWGGRVVTGERLAQLSALLQSLSLQIESDLYLVPIQPEAADRVNHSCSPNAGMRGQIALVAMRDIMPDEEVCFDYAMTDESDYDEFKCRCGEPTCRGRVTGNDWKLPELWAKYDGYFSTYIQQRIEQLKAESRMAEA